MTSPSRRKHRITAPKCLAKAIRISSRIASRERLLSAALAAATLLPNYTFADKPQPSFFKNSIAAQATPIGRSSQPADAQWAEIRNRRIGTSATTLRWQNPAVASSPAAFEAIQPASHVEPAAAQPIQVANKVLAWGQDEAKAGRSHVRLVTQLGEIDPFDDPFGDHSTEFNEPRARTFISQPDTPPLPAVDPEPTAPQRDPEFSPFREEAPEPAPLNELEPQAEPFREDAAPLPPATNERGFRDPVIPRAQPYQTAADCDKIYNERNCCTDGEQCQHARRRVRENSIDKISLNISPSFKPDATTEAEVEQARTLRLAQSAIRSWRNRDGEVVARGQVTNLQFGRVYIEDDGEVAKVPVGELSDDDWCFLAAWWGVPTECSLGDDKYQRREWLASTMTWKASGLCHKPLYFEEVQLERYGHSAGTVLQPVLSGAHFFLNIATLPYQMGMSPPNECEYALGYYRPGNCAPWLLPPVPLSVRGGLMQAGAIVGGVYVLP